jgi:chromate transporter
VPLTRRQGAVALGLFVALLIALPTLASVVPSPSLAVVDRFYRVGSLVFGGGHVVLPLLRAEVRDWVTESEFVAGYGAAQAVPGPLFTFAAYLGATRNVAPAGVIGAALALVAIFLPAFLLVVGALPFWDGLRTNAGMPAALAGVNAAVAGLLIAALYTPVWTSAIFGPRDFALAVLAFVALAWWKAPPWLVVVATALIAQLLPA